MTLTAARSLHTAIPVPPPPRGDEEAEASRPCAPSSPAAKPSRPPAAGPSASAVAGPSRSTVGGAPRAPEAGSRGVSVLDLDGDALDTAGFTRPQTSRPPRPRPVQPPTSVDETGLRRQRLWVVGATAGFGVTSVAVIASWFL